MDTHGRVLAKIMSLPVMVLIATFFAMVFALRVVGRVDQFVLLWPVAGLQLGLMLPTWRAGWRRRFGAQAAGTIGVLAGGISTGLPAWFALQLAILSSIDVLVAGSLLSPGVERFDDLKCRDSVFRLGAAATLAPLLTGVLATSPVADFLKTAIPVSAALSLMANSLGIVLVLPAVLFLVSGKYRNLSLLAPHWKKSLLGLLIFTAVVAAVFWQNTGPFLFIVFPPMIAVLLFMGLEGALVISVVVSAIGWFATSYGHGPIWLARGASPEFRLLLLQVFIWMCVATAMPVGALLDERRKAERDLAAATSIYRTLLQHADDMIVLSALDGSNRYVSPAVEKLTGWTAEEYLALSRRETLHPEDREVGDVVLESLASGKQEHTMRVRLLRKDGGWRWVDSTIRGFTDNVLGNVCGYVATVRDISDLKSTEDAWTQEKLALAQERTDLVDLASMDPLTGLANRRAFDRKMLQHQSDGAEAQLALLMIDVDYFKLYNDTYGHQAGDACLRELGKVFETRIRRKGDLVARLGGEEFVVVLQGADASGGRSVAEGLLADVRELAMKHQGSPLGKVTVSVGVAARSVSSQFDPALLLLQADSALYISKRSGKNRASVHGATPFAASRLDAFETGSLIAP